MWHICVNSYNSKIYLKSYFSSKNLSDRPYDFYFT